MPEVLSGGEGVRGIVEEELDEQAFLEGALMPNGQTYEEWIKQTNEAYDE